MTYYKFLKAGAVSPYQEFQWTLGEWVDTGETPVDLKSGLYGCTAETVSRWVDEELYEIEYDGEPVVSSCGTGKVFGRRARLVRRVERWNERTARFVAADFAEHVAHLWVPPAGVVWVPADTIRVVRQYADGLVSKESLSAARASAREEAWEAAEAAMASARASAHAARAAAAASDAAAWAAASDAAAWAAYAAEASEQEWQSGRLLEMVGEIS